jgi:N-succinyldiaminopimelate aminotransferase
LRQAVAESERRFFGIERDAADVLITSGATEALSDALMALVEPGDEVVVFDPCYDCYVPLIRRAGGVPKIVPLSHRPTGAFSDDDLDAAFSSKTKAILINNPHNPASKVFSREELERVAPNLQSRTMPMRSAMRSTSISSLAMPGTSLFALLPDMAERTVRIGSAGKTFSLTGWKVGYMSGPAALLSPLPRHTSSRPSPPHRICRRRWRSGLVFRLATIARSRRRAWPQSAIGLPAGPAGRYRLPDSAGEGSYFLDR